jgi:sRNA-binding carbon storage regulator CsrA
MVVFTRKVDERIVAPDLDPAVTVIAIERKHP